MNRLNTIEFSGARYYTSVEVTLSASDVHKSQCAIINPAQNCVQATNDMGRRRSRDTSQIQSCGAEDIVAGFVTIRITLRSWESGERNSAETPVK